LLYICGLSIPYISLNIAVYMWVEVLNQFRRAGHASEPAIDVRACKLAGGRGKWGKFPPGGMGTGKRNGNRGIVEKEETKTTLNRKRI
jgi:hypothetical protein